MEAASIALNRFGLGARPDEAVPADPRKWLLAQLGGFEPRPAPIAALASRQQIAGELADYLDQVKALRLQAGRGGAGRPGLRAPMSARPATDPAMAAPADQMAPETAQAGAAKPPAEDPADPVAQARLFAQRQARDYYVNAVGGRTDAALISPAPFVERLVHFWANHFAISVDKVQIVGLGGLLEFEAIRPHVLGKFGDMLNAVERHPAMLLYLDQAQSVGPNSPIGSRFGNRPNRKLGLNENLAREIMELHTLGVRTGYTQADVTEFARAMTGWTVAGWAAVPARGSAALTVRRAISCSPARSTSRAREPSWAGAMISPANARRRRCSMTLPSIRRPRRISRPSLPGISRAIRHRPHSSSGCRQYI